MTLNHCRELEGLLTKKNKHLMQARELQGSAHGMWIRHVVCGSADLLCLKNRFKKLPT